MARKSSVEERYKVIDGVECKECSSCKQMVPTSEYSARNASPDGLAYSCKSCERASAAKSYKKRKMGEGEESIDV